MGLAHSHDGWAGGAKAEGNRSAKVPDWHLRVAKAPAGSFDSGPSDHMGSNDGGPNYGVLVGYAPGTTWPVSGSTWVAGGRGAMSTVKCPIEAPPPSSRARALPARPAATV